jgi:hypothetical protein
MTYPDQGATAQCGAARSALPVPRLALLESCSGAAWMFDEIIVHVGLPKAGSTTIQTTFLENNRPETVGIVAAFCKLSGLSQQRLCNHLQTLSRRLLKRGIGKTAHAE